MSDESTGDAVRKWAAEWTGMYLWSGYEVLDYDGDDRDLVHVSDADLAEAVRAKFGVGKSMEADAPAYRCNDDELDDLARDWLVLGPLGFIEAVRKVVEGK